MTHIALILFIGAVVFAIVATAQLYRDREIMRTIEGDLSERATHLENVKLHLDAREEELNRRETRMRYNKGEGEK